MLIALAVAVGAGMFVADRWGVLLGIVAGVVAFFLAVPIISGWIEGGRR